MVERGLSRHAARGHARPGERTAQQAKEETQPIPKRLIRNRKTSGLSRRWTVVATTTFANGESRTTSLKFPELPTVGEAKRHFFQWMSNPDLFNARYLESSDTLEEDVLGPPRSVKIEAVIRPRRA